MSSTTNGEGLMNYSIEKRGAISKALRFVRLDFITIKAHLTIRNLIMFAVVAIFMATTSEGSYASIGFIMMFASIYGSYPFAIGEKNNMDTLYITLSIGPGIVVLGRYLYVLATSVCAGAFAFAFAFLTSVVLQKSFFAIETLIATAIVIFAFSVIQAFQLPIFFRLGYAKARFFAYLPLIGLPFALVLVNGILGNSISFEWAAGMFAWFSENPLVFALLCLGAWLGVAVVSYRLSLRFYNNRDF